MLATGSVNFYDDWRLCRPECEPQAVALWTVKCSGLCDIIPDMIKANASDVCRQPVPPPIAVPVAVEGAAGAAATAQVVVQ